jgi:hypothetical protein
VWHQAGWRSAAAPAGPKSRPLETDASGLNRSFKDEDRDDAGIEGEHCAARKAGLAFSSVPIEDFNHANLQVCLPDSVIVLERMLKQGAHCVRSLYGGSEPVTHRRGSLSALMPGIGNSRKPLFICMHVGIACRMWMPSTAPAGRTRLDRNDGSARLVFLLKTTC